MPNGTYGGVRGKETKIGQKIFVSRPTRLLSNYICDESRTCAALAVKYRTELRGIALVCIYFCTKK